MNLHISFLIMIKFISLFNSQQFETKDPNFIQKKDINREIVFLEENSESELDLTLSFIGEENNLDISVPEEKKDDFALIIVFFIIIFIFFMFFIFLVFYYFF